VTTSMLVWLSIALISGGLGAITWLLFTDPDSAPRGALSRYLAVLDRDLTFTRAKRNAAQVATTQALLAGLLLVIAGLGQTRALYLVAVVLAGPYLLLRRRARKRRDRIVEQVDGWLVMLANMLRATGSLTDALKSTIRLTSKPLSEEVDLVVKEIELGEQVDVALRRMVARVQRPIFSAAVTGLLVGRQTGGELPKQLEQTAAAIREISRLEGVVRSKTAQGKMQLFVMALFPPAIYYGLLQMDAHFFDPLTGFIGVVVYAAAFLLWLGGILLARKILAVDV